MRSLMIFVLALAVSGCNQAFYFNSNSLDKNAYNRIFDLSLNVQGISDKVSVQEFKNFMTHELALHKVTVKNSLDDSQFYTLSVSPYQGKAQFSKSRIPLKPKLIDSEYLITISNAKGAIIWRAEVFPSSRSDFKNHWMVLAKKVILKLEEDKLINPKF
jgi:hypothetical protein